MASSIMSPILQFRSCGAWRIKIARSTVMWVLVLDGYTKIPLFLGVKHFYRSGTLEAVGPHSPVVINGGYPLSTFTILNLP